MEKFRANGKFLLTGEYLVLQGALALALPLKLGQTLEVNALEINNGVLHWDAFTPKGFWFSAMLNKSDLTVRASDDMEKAEMLSKIFQTIKSLNPNVLHGNNDYSFTTHLEFDKDWGLGSSSTLISCLSQWANVDPYEVLKRTMGGSGYDIACATATKPIIYRLKNGNPVVEEIDFKPEFSDKLFIAVSGSGKILNVNKLTLTKNSEIICEKDGETLSPMRLATDGTSIYVSYSEGYVGKT